MRTRSSAAGLARAGHPQAVLAVTLLVGALAVGVGRGWGAIGVTLAVFFGHLVIGWSNDWIDLPRDRSLGRTDKPLVTGELGTSALGWAVAVAAVAHLLLILLSGIPATLVLLGAEAVAVAYNLRLKDLPVSVLAYAFSFGLLPAVITLGLTPPRFPAWWAVVAAALLGVAGHLTQVLGDIPDDRARGSRGFPQLLGRGVSTVLAAACLVAGGVCVVLGAGLPALLAVPLLLLLAGAVAGFLAGARARRPRLAFRLTLAAALVVAAALLASGRGIVA
ncbi:MAG: UbiA family prenyltransferase [Candidatus Dormibacteraceae bacterium]